jgi:hypothetical protein
LKLKQTEILKNVIGSLKQYHLKQESFKQIFSNEPVMSKAIEVFDTEMDEMVEHIFDLIGIPNGESSNNKYERKNWTRDVCTNLVKIAAENEKYVEPAVELISDWKRMGTYTAKVEKHTWFGFYELLDEHINGYKNWEEEQRIKDNDKDKSNTA